MTEDVIINRDQLYNRLAEVFEATPINVRPWSPVKWERGEGKDIVLCYPDKHKIVGTCPQVLKGPYKIWFHEHPEWELETTYPIKKYAENGTPGSGDGFYVETIGEVVSEFIAFFKTKYPDLVKAL